MKTSEVRISLLGLARQLDIQWTYTSRVEEMLISKDLLPHDENGKPGPTLQRIAYENMIVAFEAMGGEWSRKVDGHHRLCLFGVFVETFPDEES